MYNSIYGSFIAYMSLIAYGIWIASTALIIWNSAEHNNKCIMADGWRQKQQYGSHQWRNNVCIAFNSICNNMVKDEYQTINM